MGLFPSFDLAQQLAKLVSSPRVQYIGRQLKSTVPQVSGPFGANAYRSNSGNGGSAPRIGASALPGVMDALQQVNGVLGAQQPQQQQDPLMSLYQQLIGQLQQPVNMPTGIDTADLMRQVQAAINPIYDQRAKSAEARTGRATKDVRSMYGQLADDYEKLAPQQIQQAKAAQGQVEQLYGQLRSNIEGSYSRVAKEQGDLFKSLGIESALPEVLNDQAPQVQEASLAASQNQTQQSQRYMDMGQIDSTYMREGSPLATMTGNDISTSFLADLQDYLGQVEAERSSGIQTAYMDQLGQAKSQLAQQQQTAQSETARRQEMLFQMLQGSMNGKQQQSLTADGFMGQLPPQVQQSLAGAFTQLQRSPEAVYGKVEDPRNPVPGTFVETTPEWYMAQADQMLASGQIDAATHQALLQYLMLNFKSGQ